MSEQGKPQDTDMTEPAASGSTAADEVSDDVRERDTEVRRGERDEDRERDLDEREDRDREERDDRDLDERDERDRDDDDLTPDEPTTAEDAPRMAAGDDDGDDDEAKGDEDPREEESEEDKRRREEEFAAEHDPADHDISAGEEFRQPGDWTAEEAGGEQKWDADGNLVEGSHPGEPDGPVGEGDDSGRSTDGRRVSSLDEIRDGGYGVGSAAPIDDGAMPMDHAVKAWEDTKSYLCPGEDGYDGADPHVWFLNGDYAQEAGFHHAG